MRSETTLLAKVTAPNKSDRTEFVIVTAKALYLSESRSNINAVGRALAANSQWRIYEGPDGLKRGAYGRLLTDILTVWGWFEDGVFSV